MSTQGMLWIWGDKDYSQNQYLSPILKEARVLFRYLTYTEGSLAMNPNFQPEADLIFALGNAPLTELKNYGLIRKNLTIGSSRGTIYTLPNQMRVLTSYSCNVRNVDYSLYVDFLGDVQLALRLLQTGSLVPPMLDFKWVPDLSSVLDVIESQEGIIDAAIDLETTGLVAYSADTWIVTFQVSTDEKSSKVVKFEQDFQPRKPDFNVDQGTPQCREELLWVQINRILTHPKVSLKGANLKYDLGWIAEKWGIECTNFKFDTLLVGSLLDENRSNSLKTHAYVYTPYGGYESDLYDRYDIAAPQDVPADVLLPYCGYDTAVCLQVARKQREELDKTDENQLLKRFYIKILHPAARAYERVERTGVLVDVDYYLGTPESALFDVKAFVEGEMANPSKDEKEALAKDDKDKYEKLRADRLKATTQIGEIKRLGFKGYLEDKLQQNKKKAHKILAPTHLLAKYMDNTDLSRAAMIADYLFDKARGLGLKPVMFTAKKDKNGNDRPSTALEHFLKFKDHPVAGEFVGILQEYKDCAKTLSTYVDGFLKHLRYDHRFHASFFLFKGGSGGSEDDAGTNSGRISIVDPALQTIPKKTKWAKPLRRAFIAPPGYVFFSGDYSQGELRIAADFANEERMIWAYNNGMDLHAVTGAGLAEIPLETFMSYKGNQNKEWRNIFEVNRQKAKGANFGLLYGMGAEGFQIYAETAYKVKMTLKEATEARDKFFATYPRLQGWHEETKALAMRQGFVISPLGRVRHLPLLRSPDRQVASKEQRRAVNSPVQGTLSDMSLWATALLDKQGYTKKAPICLMVHDQLCAYLPEDNWQYYAKIYKETMENLPFHEMGWEPKIKFEVDVQISLGNKEKGIPPNLADLKELKDLGVTL